MVFFFLHFFIFDTNTSNPLESTKKHQFNVTTLPNRKGGNMLKLKCVNSIKLKCNQRKKKEIEWHFISFPFKFNDWNHIPVCLLESSFFLESELFSDVW
jgi:hypothetical protein